MRGTMDQALSVQFQHRFLEGADHVQVMQHPQQSLRTNASQSLDVAWISCHGASGVNLIIFGIPFPFVGRCVFQA